MGQHLHLYASSDVTPEEVNAWASCRADEYFRMPSPGFEETAFKKICAIMDQHDNDAHLECGSTWCVNIWSDFVWTPRFCDDALLIKAMNDLEHFFIDRPALPNIGQDWLQHPIFDFLKLNRGKIVWGENDGI